MARYYRRRGYRRPYSVSFRFGRQRRRFNRQFAAAMQQRDIARFVVRANFQDSVSIATAQGFFAITGYQARDILNRSDLFGNLKKSFDQFKVNAIKVKIVPIEIISANNSNIESVICWDRNGANVGNITFDDLCTYGSAKINYYTPGAKTTQTHWISAETISEKSSYIPCENATANNSALFDPYFFIGIKGPRQLAQGEMYAVNCAMEWSFDVTFRGLRAQ